MRVQQRFQAEGGQIWAWENSLNQKLEQVHRKLTAFDFDQGVHLIGKAPSGPSLSGDRRANAAGVVWAHATIRFQQSARKGPTGGARGAAASPGHGLWRAGSHVPA